LCSYTVLGDYWAIKKPDVNFLIVIATYAGFYLGYPKQTGSFPRPLLVHSLLGLCRLRAAQVRLISLKRRFDAQVRRTARGPLAASRLKSFPALQLRNVAVCHGLNALTSMLALLTFASYSFNYTPLKRKTPFCMLVVALPGAMPPPIGWAAAAGSLSSEAWHPVRRS
jgi:protoheme IX farnesyltransferase